MNTTSTMNLTNLLSGFAKNIVSSVAHRIKARKYKKAIENNHCGPYFLLITVALMDGLDLDESIKAEVLTRANRQMRLLSYIKEYGYLNKVEGYPNVGSACFPDRVVFLGKNIERFSSLNSVLREYAEISRFAERAYQSVVGAICAKYGIQVVAK